MSGLTDKQFEMVCRVATTAAGEDSDRLPALLEELLAAARRGLGTDGKPWDEEWRKYLCRTKTEIDADSRRLIDQLKAGLDAHSEIEDAPGPHEHPQVGIHGSYTPEPNKIPPPPPKNRTINSNETTRGES